MGYATSAHLTLKDAQGIHCPFVEKLRNGISSSGIQSSVSNLISYLASAAKAADVASGQSSLF